MEAAVRAERDERFRFAAQGKQAAQSDAGTLSLYAALDVKTGKVEGKTLRHHTGAEFIGFLAELLGKAKWAREIHIVLDNLSAHKIQAVEEFLAEHPKVRFHFTPTYSSWLNQVDVWFGKIQRDVITRGIFTSVGDLARKVRCTFELAPSQPNHSTGPIPDPTRRIQKTSGASLSNY